MSSSEMLKGEGSVNDAGLKKVGEDFKKSFKIGCCDFSSRSFHIRREFRF